MVSIDTKSVLIALVVSCVLISVVRSKERDGGAERYESSELEDLQRIEDLLKYLTDNQPSPPQNIGEDKRGGVFRFGKRGGVFRFGKREDQDDAFRFNKKGNVFRFGKRLEDILYRDEERPLDWNRDYNY